MTLVQTFARIDSWRTAEACGAPVTPVLPSREFEAVCFELFRSTPSPLSTKAVAFGGRRGTGGSAALFPLPPHNNPPSTVHLAALAYTTMHTLRAAHTLDVTGGERGGRPRQASGPAAVPVHEVMIYAGQDREEACEEVGGRLACAWCARPAVPFVYRESGASFPAWRCDDCGWWC